MKHPLLRLQIKLLYIYLQEALRDKVGKGNWDLERGQGGWPRLRNCELALEHI